MKDLVVLKAIMGNKTKPQGAEASHSGIDPISAQPTDTGQNRQNKHEDQVKSETWSQTNIIVEYYNNKINKWL